MPYNDATPDLTNAAILERLALVEQMVSEGRRSTQSWGWNFLLWGFAYLLATCWMLYWPHPNLSWPVTMIVTAAICALTIHTLRKRAHAPTTAVTRSLSSIWTVIGITIFVYAFCASYTGHAEPHSYIATILLLLGVANGASSVILRWSPQFIAAFVWWAAGVATFYLPTSRLNAVFIAANILGNIVFGAWLTFIERAGRNKGHV